MLRWLKYCAVAACWPLLSPPTAHAQAAAPGPGPVCQTRAGRLQGTRAADGLVVFRGVAYAAAPAGAGRFLPPRPLAPWADVRPATAFGPRAPQGSTAGPQGEDNCLTLNVWTPSVRARQAKPVVVWVHGGAFTGGAGSEFDGGNFARHDSLVAVSLNYRLGSLGFLQLSQWLGPYRQSGNAGVLDAVAALRWVHDNIAAFGGDPGRVTVMGESAGAKLVGAIMATPAARGLFQQVILESGGVQAVRDTATAAAVAQRLLGALGLRPDQAAQLLTLPTADIIRAQEKIAAGPAGLQLFGPVLDGLTIPEAPLAYLTRPGHAPLRALVGTNRDEAGLFMGFWPALQQPNAEVLTTLFGTNGGPVWQAYEHRAAADPPAGLAWLRNTTDYLYRLASYRLAGALADAGQPTWLYRFDYQAPGGPGPVHAQELSYAWNALGPVARQSATARALAAQMHQRWVAFIATGTPGVAWPAYRPAQRQAMVFDSVSRARPLPAPYEDATFPSQAFRL